MYNSEDILSSVLFNLGSKPSFFKQHANNDYQSKFQVGAESFPFKQISVTNERSLY